MRAIVLLAQSAALDQAGTVHALGLGWTASPTPVPQHALVIFVEVEWAELNKSFPIRAELVDSDGVRVAHTEHGVIKAKHKPVHPDGYTGHHPVHRHHPVAQADGRSALPVAGVDRRRDA